jgi:hypothetical protein
VLLLLPYKNSNRKFHIPIENISTTSSISPLIRFILALPMRIRGAIKKAGVAAGFIPTWSKVIFILSWLS